MVKDVAQAINKHMIEHRISGRAAAKISGLSESTISEIRSGKDKRLSFYFIVAQSIGIETQTLFNTHLTHLQRQLLAATSSMSDQKIIALINYLTEK
ncbi:hypothetical protein B1199_02905 [Pseudoalteromonas ulvae]|uniref:HTH cro/C1-type domain-containing protein n=2 Tax=Pseudoalteromonas ulvae TaxID=107327 RepID=A0A244CUD2_PSEDV|nr:hypothetical protein B1199_02905 [Pseudoalteromonas ulvae]